MSQALELRQRVEEEHLRLKAQEEAHIAEEASMEAEEQARLKACSSALTR